MDNRPLYDLIVFGGSISGCLAAIKAGREGASVLIIEPRSYLGREFAATLRPWVCGSGLEQADPELYSWMGIADAIPGKEECPFKLGALKKKLLSSLLEAGVEVLFMSAAAGVLMSAGRASGVIVSNKSGMQAFTSAAVIDATENQVLHRLIGAEEVSRPDACSWHFTIEFTGVSPGVPKSITLPPELGTDLILHPALEGDGHIYAEFAVRRDTPEDGDYSALMRQEAASRLLTIRICEFLRRHVPAFGDAVLLRTSAEPGLSAGCRYEDVGAMGLFSLQSAGLRADRQSWSELKRIEEVACATVDRVLGTTGRGEHPELAPIHVRTGNAESPLDEWSPVPVNDPALGITGYNVALPGSVDLPALAGCDILVAGGGTAGAPAAIGAAEGAAKVVVVENQSGLGGTGTLGGINVYWFGNTDGFTAELDSKVKTMTERLSKPVLGKLWNIEAKMLTYLDEIDRLGGEVLFRSRVAGVRMDGRTIREVVVGTPNGLFAMPVKCVIDATGDGDVAAMAGVPYTVGDPRGGNLQTYNHCSWIAKKELAGVNIDRGVIDATNAFDLTRGILAGHDHAAEYDFSPYPAVRESRHIACRYTLTVTDVLTERRFPDTIAVGRTDFDQHGLQSSAFARLGYLPYHRDSKTVRFPYRACIPVEVANLLVTGKAFSAERDAFSFMRMQPDLQNMGYAVGTAAALSVMERTAAADIDMSLLQSKLLGKGIIRTEDRQPQEEPSPEELIAEAGDPDGFVRLIAADRERVVPALRSAYNNPGHRSVHLALAMALAWFGQPDGVGMLIEALQSLRRKRQGDTIDSSGRPVGGFIESPDVYWRVNQLITVLGMTKDSRAADLLCDLMHDTDAGGPPRPHARLHWRRVPNYDRIVCLCESIERTAPKKAVAALESLLDKPYLSGHVARRRQGADESYASAYLELTIARTLAACGGARGRLVLVAYLDDVRPVLAEHARSELRKL